MVFTHPHSSSSLSDRRGYLFDSDSEHRNIAARDHAPSPHRPAHHRAHRAALSRSIPTSQGGVVRGWD